MTNIVLLVVYKPTLFVAKICIIVIVTAFYFMLFTMNTQV